MRRYNRNNKNKREYFKYNRIYKTEPSTFGQGYRFIILSRIVAVQADTVQKYEVYNVVSTKEWNEVKNNFKFFKIDKIALIFLTRVYPVIGNQDSMYVNINYDSTLVENPSMQDNTQMISAYLPRPKTLLYRVPHINVESVTLNAWLNVFDMELALAKINFTLSSPDNAIPWNFRLEVGIKCRLPTNSDETRYKKQLINIKNIKSCVTTTNYKEVVKIKNYKEEEEEEEKNKKEEKENKEDEKDN